MIYGGHQMNSGERSQACQSSLNFVRPKHRSVQVMNDDKQVIRVWLLVGILDKLHLVLKTVEGP